MPDDTEVMGPPDGPEEPSTGASRRGRWLAGLGLVALGAALALGVGFVVSGDDDETGTGAKQRSVGNRGPSTATSPIATRPPVSGTSSNAAGSSERAAAPDGGSKANGGSSIPTAVPQTSPPFTTPPASPTAPHDPPTILVFSSAETYIVCTAGEQVGLQVSWVTKGADHAVLQFSGGGDNFAHDVDTYGAYTQTVPCTSTVWTARLGAANYWSVAEGFLQFEVLAARPK